MTRPVSPDPVDERLKQLLDIEARLAGRIAEARRDAERRVATERADRDRRLAAAIEAADRADAERAETERAAHARELAALDAAHRARLAVLTNIPDETIDALARRALDRAIDPEGERS